MTAANAFLDPVSVARLYDDPTRLHRRSSALMQAKVEGPGVSTTIANLVRSAGGRRPRTVLEIGSGEGATARALLGLLRPDRLLCVDRSTGLLAVAARTATGAQTTCADFHQLPVPDGAVDLAVAAFCLYHSPTPGEVVAEVHRVLAPGGVAVFVTKHTSSYSELDLLLRRSGLLGATPPAPSLYGSFNSENALNVVAGAMDVDRVVHHQHVFRFADLGHVARYVATSPKYDLPRRLERAPHRLAHELRRRIADGPVQASSIVTYVVGHRP